MTLNVVLIILLIGVLLGAMLIGWYFSRALSSAAGGYYPSPFPLRCRVLPGGGRQVSGGSRYRHY